MSRSVMRRGVGQVAGGALARIQIEADRRGHGNATLGAVTGAALGAALGSFGGPGSAMFCAAIGAGLGYVVGESWD